MIQVVRESHETPQYAALALLLAGGRNRFGEPNFRAVWGQNRFDWIGGKWVDHAEDGSILREVVEVRYTHKYAPLDRWHIERWCPPEMYGSPEAWAKQTLEIENGINIPALGPYPSRGEYEHVFTLESPVNGFLQLTENIARYVAQLCERSRVVPKAVSKAALYKREEVKEKQYDSWADAVLSDC